MFHPRLDGREAKQRASRAAALMAQDARVRLVFLFGSAMDESVPEVADVDLAVLADPPLDLDERLRLQARLARATKANIELVPLDRASVTLLHEVANHGTCLFARASDDELAFVTRARARFWDFRPYLAEQWRLAAARQEVRRRGPQA